MSIIIITLLLITCIITSLFGYKLGNKGVLIITIIGLFITLITMFITSYDVIINNSFIKYNVGMWMHNGYINTLWEWRFDIYTSIMLILVITMTILVQFYSIEYMANDLHLNRFLSIITLFCWFMIQIITGNNIILLLIGWEGVGVCSYLLINHWWSRIEANKAAIKAIIMNRIGDIFIIVIISEIMINLKTTDFELISILGYLVINDSYKLIGICIILGISAKSAQIGLHTWLLGSMEGLTLVSALIHAATMVTAGVFILYRLVGIMNLEIFIYITIIGSITAIYSGIIGWVQFDIKKIIAYSTCSQLGYMVMIFGMGSINVSLYHLINHGWFKALLFLSAGSIIHAVNDEQDIRKYGALIRHLPITYFTYLVGTLGLIGWLFLSGFYSKEKIIEYGIITGKESIITGKYGFFIAIIAACITTIYSIRSLYIIFINRTNSLRTSLSFAKENGKLITGTLITLSIITIINGYLTEFVYISLIFWFNTNVISIGEIIEELLTIYGMILMILIMMILISWIGIYLKSNILIKFWNKGWNLDYIYISLLVNPILYFSHYILYKEIDRGYLEQLGRLGVTEIITITNKEINKQKTNTIITWINIIIGGVILMIYMF